MRRLSPTHLLAAVLARHAGCAVAAAIIFFLAAAESSHLLVADAWSYAPLSVAGPASWGLAFPSCSSQGPASSMQQQSPLKSPISEAFLGFLSSRPEESGPVERSQLSATLSVGARVVGGAESAYSVSRNGGGVVSVDYERGGALRVELATTHHRHTFVSYGDGTREMEERANATMLKVAGVYEVHRIVVFNGVEHRPMPGPDLAQDAVEAQLWLHRVGPAPTARGMRLKPDIVLVQQLQATDGPTTDWVSWSVVVDVLHGLMGRSDTVSRGGSYLHTFRRPAPLLASVASTAGRLFAAAARADVPIRRDGVRDDAPPPADAIAYVGSLSFPPCAADVLYFVSLDPARVPLAAVHGLRNASSQIPNGRAEQARAPHTWVSLVQLVDATPVVGVEVPRPAADTSADPRRAVPTVLIEETFQLPMYLGTHLPGAGRGGTSSERDHHNSTPAAPLSGVVAASATRSGAWGVNSILELAIIVLTAVDVGLTLALLMLLLARYELIELPAPLGGLGAPTQFWDESYELERRMFGDLDLFPPDADGNSEDGSDSRRASGGGSSAGTTQQSHVETDGSSTDNSDSRLDDGAV